jgi:hypothetical protein
VWALSVVEQIENSQGFFDACLLHCSLHARQRIAKIACRATQNDSAHSKLSGHAATA